MKDEKFELFNKIFNDDTIRTVWDKNEQKYYISVIDVVKILTNSSDPKDYWYRLKKRMSEEEKSEVSTKCRQLKLLSPDGKYRLTDVSDIEGTFRIIESIPSKNAEPIKMWLASLGSDRVNEVFKIRNGDFESM